MLKHWIWLAQRPGIGVRGIGALLRLFGTAERIYTMREQDYRDTEGFEFRWLEPLLDKNTGEAQRLLTRCDDLGIRVMTCADPQYPERLRNIPDPPAVLYYKGDFPDFDREAAIGVVGSRRCSAYGLMYAKRFGRQIADCGGLVVSGGARGVDTLAVLGALDAGAPVVAVLGCGLDIVYPRENREVFENIVRQGCLISEYPPGTPPNGRHFPVRNRIISGLSLGVLVVEAPENSGALITADRALEQGRDVFAIPGNIGVKHCEGSNRLLREGAIMVESGWDVLRDYVYMFPDKLSDRSVRESAEHAAALFRAMKADRELKERQEATTAPAPVPETLTLDERTVLELLSAEPIPADTLVARSGLPAQRLLAALTMLQIKQLALKLAGNQYQRKF